MESYFAFSMAYTFLETVGNVRLITFVNNKITAIAEPALKASLHGILLIFGQSNNKKLEKQISEFFDMPQDIQELQKTLNKVVDQLSMLDANLTASLSKIVSEIKYQPLFKFFGEIESSINEFQVIVASYGSHKPSFLKELDKFIDNYKSKNIEYKMVNYLDSNLPGSEPFIRVFIEKVMLMRKDSCCDINSSPVKFIHDFYVLIAMKIYEANNLLAMCYSLKEGLTDGAVREEDKIYLKNRKNSVVEMLRDSMKNALAPFDEPKYLTSYLSLTSSYNHKPIYAVNSESQRRFFTGPIQVERDGYVVTGLRIREMYDMIYMQIQVGKLLPMGMVDQDSVYWQELPKNVGNEHTSNVKIILSCSSFDDAIVMGVKFTAIGQFVCLQFYRKKLQIKLGTKHSELLLNAIETNYERLEAGNRKLSYLKEDSNNFKVSGEDTRVYVTLRNFSKMVWSRDNGPKAQHPFMKPFFDGSDIHFEPKVPLSGIGLMHYTNDDNHAGLIVPYLKTMKYRHIDF